MWECRVNEAKLPRLSAFCSSGPLRQLSLISRNLCAQPASIPLHHSLSFLSTETTDVYFYTTSRSSIVVFVATSMVFLLFLEAIELCSLNIHWLASAGLCPPSISRQQRQNLVRANLGESSRYRTKILGREANTP